MTKKFAHPYIIFYPTVSRDGMPFPVNRCIKDIQGRAFKEEVAWRGNIIIAKYRDNPFTSMIDASMADFALLKNYLLTHGCPRQVCFAHRLFSRLIAHKRTPGLVLVHEAGRCFAGSSLFAFPARLGICRITGFNTEIDLLRQRYAIGLSTRKER